MSIELNQEDIEDIEEQTWKCPKCKKEKNIFEYRVDELGNKKPRIYCNYCYENLHGWIRNNTQNKRIHFRYVKNGKIIDKSFSYVKCEIDIAMQKAKEQQKYISNELNGKENTQPPPVHKELHGCIHVKENSKKIVFSYSENKVRKTKEWRYLKCGLEVAMQKAKEFQKQISDKKNGII